MSVEGVAKEVNKLAGWAWNQFPGLPRKEYERVRSISNLDNFSTE